MEFVGLSPVEWTASSLLALAVLLIMFGWLIPRWVYRGTVKERDDWKSLAMHLKDTNHLLAEAARENAEPTKTVAKVMKSAQDLLTEDERLEGGGNAG